MKMFYHDIDKNQHPIGFYEAMKNIRRPERRCHLSKYAANVFGTSMIPDDARWKAFMAKPDALTLQNDPAYADAVSFLEIIPVSMEYTVSNL